MDSSPRRLSVSPRRRPAGVGGPTRHILVIGIGNPTRGDDGAGALLAERIRHLGIPDAEVCVVQQLTFEMAADWASYRRVLILDASVTGPDVDLRRLSETPDEKAGSASHSADPGILAALARQLYGRCPELWLCSLRAESVDFADQPTLSMRNRICLAEQRLLQWFRDFS